jgi:hypothetical protein
MKLNNILENIRTNLADYYYPIGRKVNFHRIYHELDETEVLLMKAYRDEKNDATGIY